MPGETTPPDTASATTERTTAKNAYATCMKQVQNRENKHINNNKNNINNNRTIVDTEDKNYRGDTPEVGIILPLCTEKLTKKLFFNMFLEKLATYISKYLTHATDVVCVVKHMMDPKMNFDNKNKPKDLGRRMSTRQGTQDHRGRRRLLCPSTHTQSKYHQPHRSWGEVGCKPS